MNKAYKVLRIILVTLTIILILFNLFKRVVSAQELIPTVPGFENEHFTYPLPYGANAGQSYGKLGTVDLNPVVDYFLNVNNGITGITFAGFDENNSDVAVFVGFYGAVINFSGDDYNLANYSAFWFTGGQFYVGYNISSGTLVNIPYFNANQLYTHNYCLLANAQMYPDYYYFPKNVWANGYPIYYAGGDITFNGQTIFYYSSADPVEPEPGGSTTGTVTGSGESSNYDENGDPIGSSTYEYELEIEIDLSEVTNGQAETNEKLDDIYSGITSNYDQQVATNSKLDSVNSKLDDIKARLSTSGKTVTDWLKAIYEYLTGSFDEEEFSEEVEDLEVFQLIDGCKSSMNSNVSCFNTRSVTEPIFTFDISGPVMGEDQVITLDLTSYDDYRDQITPLITMILTVTFVFSLFNDLPNLFHGVSGQDNVN